MNMDHTTAIIVSYLPTAIVLIAEVLFLTLRRRRAWQALLTRQRRAVYQRATSHQPDPLSNEAPT